MKAKNILAVDTSSRVLSVAIKAGESIFESNLEGSQRHSEQLIELVQTGLKRLKIKKMDLNELRWGLGPGSFTGLRIGISVLKGLHLGLKAKAYGASSLDLIALGSQLVSGDLAVCVDARREMIYAAIYRFKEGVPQKKLQDDVLSIDQLLKKVNEDTAFAGDALTTYGERIKSKLGKNVLFLGTQFWYPHATHLLSIKPDWLMPLTLKTMAPRYFRPSLPEERLKRK